MQISFSTTGNQYKYWNNGYLYKQDTFGYEGIAEVLCNELLLYIEDLEGAKYYLCRVNGMSGCKSESFLKDDESTVSIQDLLNVDDFWYIFGGYSPTDKFNNIIERVSKVANIDISSYLCRVLLFDAIVLNEDRHFNNISLLYSQSGYSVSPVYDNGISLLSNIVKYPMSGKVSVMLREPRCKPFCYSFASQVNLVKQFSTELLRIRYTDFNKRISRIISSLDNYVFDKQQEDFKRAVNVLYKMLQSTEGICWERI